MNPLPLSHNYMKRQYDRTGSQKISTEMSEQDSQSAFREFYDMTYDRLFRIAYYYTHHEEWSQEIVLDVFMKLWEHRKQLLDIANIEDYCFILVKNASLNYIEKEERRPTLSAEVLQEPADQDVSPEDTLISEELFARYVKALDRLPERCREVFILIREENRHTHRLQRSSTSVQKRWMHNCRRQRAG